MTKNFASLLLFLSFTVLAFYACTDSDEYLFNEKSTTDIEIDAYMARSFETESDRKKQDTIVPGDSLIFLTSIYPSKSIRLQRYYWTINGKLFANEYSFKNTVNETGVYDIAFVLIDFFGDTLSDTLRLYVAAPPELNVENFIPNENTQSVNPTSRLNFVWDCQTADTLWKVSYHFVLKDLYEDEIVVDTILQKAQYTHTRGFKSLSKYQWTVTAHNELNQKSENTLESVFYTSGFNGESAITGTLKNTSADLSIRYNITLLDTSLTEVLKLRNYETSPEGNFVIKPVTPGNYTLIVRTEYYTDFKSDTVKIHTRNDLITLLDPISLSDQVTPSIQHELDQDSLDFTDTLKFIVRDGGGELQVSKMSAMLDATTIPAIKLSHDTLSVPLPESLENSWTVRILTIAVLDQSGNKTIRTFYIKPNHTLDEVRQ